MNFADLIAILLVLVAIVAGYAMGFGRQLRVFTKGILGIIISVVICYFIFGVVTSWGFVQDLMNAVTEAVAGGNESGIRYFLAYRMQISYLITAVVLFIVVQIIRIVIVKFFSHVLESNNLVSKIFNKTLGIILSLVMLALVVLIVFQILAWIGGNTYENVLEFLDGSLFRLDDLFTNNPLMTFVDNIRGQ